MHFARQDFHARYAYHLQPAWIKNLQLNYSHFNIKKKNKKIHFILTCASFLILFYSDKSSYFQHEQRGK